MIDFELPADVVALRDRVQTFIAHKIVPYENDIRQTAHGAPEPLRRELVALARESGLLSPNAPKEYGGLGLDHRGMPGAFEPPASAPPVPLAPALPPPPHRTPPPPTALPPTSP